MVRRVAGGVDNLKHSVAGLHQVAVSQGAPRHGIALVPLWPGELGERQRRVTTGKRHGARGVVAVVVRHNDGGEPRTGQCLVERGHMLVPPGAGIHEQRPAAWNQPGHVARAGERARVEGVNRDGLQKWTFNRA